MAPSISLAATPGSAIWRTITSRRGSRTVALRRSAPDALRNRPYSAPHSAAGRGGVVFVGQTAQHLDLVGAHPRYRDFEIRGADLQAHAGAEGEQLTEVFEDGKIQRHVASCSTWCRTSAGCGWG